MGWQLIESQSLQASAASVTFSSIPQTYKTLKLNLCVRGDYNGYNSLAYQLNGSTSGYTGRTLNGSNATTSSGTITTVSVNSTTYGRITNGYTNSANSTANMFSSIEMNIPNYSGNTNKPISVDWVSEDNVGTSYITSCELDALLWSDTSAITSITFGLYTGSTASNFVFGSTFTLYGLT